MSDPVTLLRERKGKRSLRHLGKEIGVSAMFLSHVLRGLRHPGPKILKWLGLEKRVVYEAAPDRRKKRARGRGVSAGA